MDHHQGENHLPCISFIPTFSAEAKPRFFCDIIIIFSEYDFKSSRELSVDPSSTQMISIFEYV